MSHRLQDNINELKVLAKCKPYQRKAFLNKANKELIYCISDICYNILRGNILLTPLQKKQLKRYKNNIRYLGTKKGTKLAQKRALIQKGGFLPLLLAPLFSIATDLLSDLIRKQ